MVTKKVLAIIGVLLLVLVGVYFYGKRNQVSVPVISNCDNSNLEALVQFQGAAGSTYGDLTLTNTSANTCLITLFGNSIKADYDATNISVVEKNSAASQTFALAPSAKAYSRVHYLNGAGCQSGTSQTQISLSYEDGSTKIFFKDEDGNSKFNMTTCLKSQDTPIDIWPLSKDPVIN